MLVALFTLLAGVTTYLGYLTSVFATSVFVDADQLDELLPEADDSQKKFLQEVSDDPGAMMQAATFFKWLTLFSVSVLAFTAFPMFSNIFSLTPLVAFAGSLLAGLVIVFVALEALPRRRSLQSVDKRFLTLVPALRFAFLISHFYIRFHRSSMLKRATPLSEDVKEEIVERAIESLADSVGAHETIIEEDEREMIESIFQLDTTEVQEVMTPRVDLIAIDINTPLKKLREIAAKHGYSRYPVFEDTIDNIKGALYIKDIFTKPPVSDKRFSVGDYVRESYVVPLDMSIDDLLAAFKTKKVHLAIVIDEYGGTAGIVTLEDILEVIVGDIQDEHDTEKPEFREVSPGVYDVDANLPLAELAEKLDLEYDEEEFETVGGLLYDLCGSVPSEGEELKWNKLTFSVSELEGQRIDRVRITCKS